MKNVSMIKTAAKNIRKGAKNYIAYCDKCAAERGIARKNDARYDSKMFAKALAGGAAIYLTVAAVDLAIDVAPMVVEKIKGMTKSDFTFQNIKRETAMRKATLDHSVNYSDYYIDVDTMKMNHGEIHSDVVAKMRLDAENGTLPRIILGNLDSDALVDEVYTVDGQPKCCPHGEDPATTEHEEDVTFPMFGDEHDKNTKEDVYDKNVKE